MAKYKFVLYFPNGNEFDSTDDGLIFDDEESAQESALYHIGCYYEGGEILNLSNPGDYDYDPNEEADYEVFEIEEQGY